MSAARAQGISCKSYLPAQPAIIVQRGNPARCIETCLSKRAETMCSHCASRHVLHNSCQHTVNMSSTLSAEQYVDQLHALLRYEDPTDATDSIGRVHGIVQHSSAKASHQIHIKAYFYASIRSYSTSRYIYSTQPHRGTVFLAL